MTYAILRPARRREFAKPTLGSNWSNMSGKPMPPSADPVETSPMAKARRCLKCWPTTARAGWTPKEIDRPIKRPCVMKTSQNWLGWVKDSMKSATMVPAPEPM